MKNVWIIDNDPIFVYLVQRLLDTVEFDGGTQIFWDAWKALNEIKEHRATPELLPQIIILDIDMPLLTGWEFIAELEKISGLPPLRIYMVTSSINPDDRIKAVNHRLIHGFILKPLDLMTIEKITKMM
jgi:CheY-like chemotaxis protein